MSPYTLSDMFSYYVYKIRKLCPFLHYWVINLSSLSGSPVKPSSKMNYGCRQQSGACMSLSFSQYVCADKQACMSVYTCVSAHYISPCKRKIKLHAQESEGQGSLLSFAVHISHPLESAPRGILCSSAAFFLSCLWLMYCINYFKLCIEMYIHSKRKHSPSICVLALEGCGGNEYLCSQEIFCHW